MTSLATGDVHREDDEGLPSETMLIEYDVEQDEEIRRIRNSIKNMEVNGGVYTGETPVDLTPSKIKSITSLIDELEKRGGSKDVWQMRAEHIYNAFTSPKPPSKSEFFQLMEKLMPLTTEQTEDAVSLLSQRSKVSKKLLFIAGAKRKKQLSHSPSSAVSRAGNSDKFFNDMLKEVTAIESSIIHKRTPHRSKNKTTPKRKLNFSKLNSGGKRSITVPSLEELADSESPLNSEGFNSDKNKHSDVNTGTSSTRVRKVFPSDSVQQSPKPRLSLVDLIANSPKNKNDDNVPFYLLASLRRHIRRRALTLPSLFAMWDKNRDGLLTKRNLKNGLLNFGMETTTDEIDRLFRYFDAGGTGHITMKRFNKLLKYKTRFGSPNPYILTGRGEKSSEKGIDLTLSNDERKMPQVVAVLNQLNLKRLGSQKYTEGFP